MQGICFKLGKLIVFYGISQGDTLDYLGIPGLHLAGSQGVIVIAVCQALLMVRTFSSCFYPILLSSYFHRILHTHFCVDSPLSKNEYKLSLLQCLFIFTHLLTKEKCVTFSHVWLTIWILSHQCFPFYLVSVPRFRLINYVRIPINMFIGMWCFLLLHREKISSQHILWIINPFDHIKMDVPQLVGGPCKDVYTFGYFGVSIFHSGTANI